jgi:ribonucleoside-diphosphate reductase alpha chain
MNREQVYKTTLEYFYGNELLTNVWIDKHCLKDGDDFKESSPDEMHWRHAKEFARIERKYPNPMNEKEIYDLFKDYGDVIVAGSPAYGIGNPYSISSLGNCFVIGAENDSIGGIFNIGEEQAQLMKRRAGVGHDLSYLREKKAKVSNAAQTSTGVETWEDLYSEITRHIAQDGRRGALMLTYDIERPDAMHFIMSKDDLSKVTGANISVKLSNQFMETIGDENLYFYNNKLWKQLVHQAWKSAEPGVLFWDKIKSESIPSCYGKEWEETSTNPCGEIPLCPYDSCRLISVNLVSFVEHPFTDKATFNWDRFKEISYKAQRLMDDVVDLEEEKINLILNKIEKDPESEKIKSVEKNLWLKIRTKLLDGRRTGLSAIGLGDCFAALGWNYCGKHINSMGNTSNSKNINSNNTFSDSTALAEEIYKQFAILAYISSTDMAQERGCFPIWNGDLEENNPFLKRVLDENFLYIAHGKYGRRNIALLTIPPSGTISQFANRIGISSGIEPVYQLEYKRRRKVNPDNPNIKFIDAKGDCWEEYIVRHPNYERCLEIMPQVISGEPLRTPYYKSTAYEIDPIQRIKLQGAIQKWVDHSISSTLNLPENTTEGVLSDIYFNAWKEGLKGVTVYRNNCRTGVLVDVEEFKQHDAPKRPKSLDCEVHKVKSKGREWTIVVGLYSKKPYEIFATLADIPTTKSEGLIIKAKKGKYDLQVKDDGYYEDVAKDIPDEENMLTRMISTALRHGASIKFIVEQLNKSTGDITAFARSIVRVLKKYVSDGSISHDLCPKCGSKLIYQNGCKECSKENDNNCTYSVCG